MFFGEIMLSGRRRTRKEVHEGDEGQGCKWTRISNASTEAKLLSPLLPARPLPYLPPTLRLPRGASPALLPPPPLPPLLPLHLPRQLAPPPPPPIRRSPTPPLVPPALGRKRENGSPPSYKNTGAHLSIAQIGQHFVQRRRRTQPSQLETPTQQTCVELESDKIPHGAILHLKLNQL